MNRNLFAMAIVVLSLTALVSCGGGSGGGGSGGGGGDGSDGSLNANLSCPDSDGDGYGSVSCGGVDCNDTDPDINPLARDICGDNIDQNCDGIDRLCTDGGVAAHSSLAWDGSPSMCLSCHMGEAEDMYASTHYQWQGDALYMSHGPMKQGKIAGAVNSYCINISGNWAGCGNCHVGLGAQPQAANNPTAAQLKNIDCLVCHQKEYKRVKSGANFVPDTANMTISLDEAVQTVHMPERINCLQCHAKAGGGDAVKRGDLAEAESAAKCRHAAFREALDHDAELFCLTQY